MKDINVIILAGGRGTRLRPYSTVFPKPLMPVGEMPILEIVLRQLKSYGFGKIFLSVNHLANLIQTFFGDGSKLDLEIEYCIEDKPLGTAGSISLIPDLSENFLVMNGDILTTINYAELVNAHIHSDSIATIGIFPREVKVDFGVLHVKPSGKLLSYDEKPTIKYLVSMGINIFHRSVLEFIPHDDYLEIPTLILNLLAEGKTVSTFKSDCEWLDIGRSEDYEKAVEIFDKSQSKYLTPCFK